MTFSAFEIAWKSNTAFWKFSRCELHCWPLGWVKVFGRSSPFWVWPFHRCTATQLKVIDWQIIWKSDSKFWRWILLMIFLIGTNVLYTVPVSSQHCPIREKNHPGDATRAMVNSYCGQIDFTDWQIHCNNITKTLGIDCLLNLPQAVIVQSEHSHP